SGTLNAQGVTFVLVGSSKVVINGNATVNVNAPPPAAEGQLQPPTPGIAFFQDRAAPAGLVETFGGTSKQSIGGAIYFPKASVTYNGTPTLNGPLCTQIIADKLTFNGANTLNFNCAG